MNMISSDVRGRILLVPVFHSSPVEGAEVLNRVLSATASVDVAISYHDDDLKTLAAREYSAVILYNWTAEATGLNAILSVRDNLPELPILVIGASDGANARIAAFEAGADNYVCADFDHRELAAKIRRLLSLSSGGRPAIAVDDLQAWPDTNIVIRSGLPIRLSSKEMEVLQCLAARAPEPVCRMTILEKAFNLSFDPGTNIVEVHIHRLRQKIDKGHDTPLINTVRGVGYVLGPVTENAPKSPQIVKPVQTARFGIEARARA